MYITLCNIKFLHHVKWNTLFILYSVLKSSYQFTLEMKRLFDFKLFLVARRASWGKLLTKVGI